MFLGILSLIKINEVISMAIGFKIDFLSYQANHRDLFHSFCSTISYYLEPTGWGTEFPYLLIHFYNGKLDWIDVLKLIGELKDIRERLKYIQTTDIILDIEDLSEGELLRKRECSNYCDLLNSFRVNDGRNLFDVLLTTLENSLIETDKEIA